jgi:hypothetical protein
MRPDYVDSLQGGGHQEKMDPYSEIVQASYPLPDRTEEGICLSGQNESLIFINVMLSLQMLESYYLIPTLAGQENIHYSQFDPSFNVLNLIPNRVLISFSLPFHRTPIGSYDTASHHSPPRICMTVPSLLTSYSDLSSSDSVRP